MGAFVHVLPVISRQQGGPSVSVRRLVESLALLEPREKFVVVAGMGEEGDDPPSEWRRVEPILCPEIGPRRFGWSPELRRAVGNAQPKMIHVHGLWRYHTWAASQVASKCRVPLVVSPRGMLEPWALQRGRIQKWIVSRLFQRAVLRQAACIVATSAQEAGSVRNAGIDRPVRVVPNGIDSPPVHARAYQGPVNSGDVRTAIFLSRIHPKKGAIDLVEAWDRVRPSGWQLKIYGPSEDNYAEKVKKLIGSKGMDHVIEVAGPVWGEDKERVLKAADLFVLPSYSENFGLAIGEALAAGLPVITTRATPWAEIESERCGWWINTGSEALENALRDATVRPRNELADMGRRGAALIERSYSWSSVAARMLELYDEVTATTATN